MEKNTDFNVLVLEDDETTRSMMVEMLKLRGYTVFAFSNPLDGLVLLRSSERIDLLVSDVRMLGSISGEQAVKTARAVRPDLKVLFVTGYVEDLSVDWTAAPETEIMGKPFGLMAFHEKVASMLSMPTGAGNLPH